MYKFLFCLPFIVLLLFGYIFFLGILFCFLVLRHLCHYFHHVDCGSVMKVNRKKHGNRYKTAYSPIKLGVFRMMNLMHRRRGESGDNVGRVRVFARVSACKCCAESFEEPCGELSVKNSSEKRGVEAVVKV